MRSRPTAARNFGSARTAANAGSKRASISHSIASGRAEARERRRAWRARRPCCFAASCAAAIAVQRLACVRVEREHRLPRGERLGAWPPCAPRRPPSSSFGSAGGAGAVGAAGSLAVGVGSARSGPCPVRSRRRGRDRTRSTSVTSLPARRVVYATAIAIVVLARVDLDDLADRIERAPRHDRRAARLARHRERAARGGRRERGLRPALQRSAP